MPNERSNITIDRHLSMLRGYALDKGHLKLATWGSEQDLIEFYNAGFDKFRQ